MSRPFKTPIEIACGAILGVAGCDLLLSALYRPPLYAEQIVAAILGALIVLLLRWRGVI